MMDEGPMILLLHQNGYIYCTKYNIIGGASKLFKYFINNHKDINEIVSFCDMRYGTGKVYNILGFNYVSTTIGFYWTNGKDRYNRQYSIGKILPPNFNKIYDCGQSKYIWKNNEII